jgi:hypothetical protein
MQSEAGLCTRRPVVGGEWSAQQDEAVTLEAVPDNPKGSVNGVAQEKQKGKHEKKTRN